MHLFWSSLLGLEQEKDPVVQVQQPVFRDAFVPEFWGLGCGSREIPKP